MITAAAHGTDLRGVPPRALCGPATLRGSAGRAFSSRRGCFRQSADLDDSHGYSYSASASAAVAAARTSATRASSSSRGTSRRTSWCPACAAPPTAASRPAPSPTHSGSTPTKLGSITRAPLPSGSPSWSDIGDMTMDEVRAAARANQPGFKTILKLLTDSRFNR